MFKRVRARKLGRLSNCALETGFHETHLRLEGLRTHIEQLGNLQGEQKRKKARFLMHMIRFARPVIQREIHDREAPGFFYFRKEEAFRSGFLVGSAAAAGALVFMACQICTLNINNCAGVVAGGVGFLASLAFMVGNTIKNRLASFARFRRNIERTLHEAEQAISRLENQPPIKDFSASISESRI